MFWRRYLSWPANVDSAIDESLTEDLDVESFDEEPLRRGRMLRCPWCETWEPLEAFVQLQTPPGYPNQCPPVYKHGGERGCKSVFAYFEAP